MRAWLDGDLTGVEPRRDLERLLEAVRAGVERDLTPFFEALARLDPVACVEIAAGPRAIAHPGAVGGALVAIDVLEKALRPMNLYPRLAELAPSLGPDLVELAARRHPDQDWVARLSRRFEVVPGRTLLAVAGAVDLCARAGFERALAEYAEQTGSVQPAVALLRAGRLDAGLRVAAACLDRTPDAPVVPWLAAVYGPRVDRLLAALGERVTTPAARERLRTLAAL